MIEGPSVRCLSGACVAFALLYVVPAAAQTTTPTTTEKKPADKPAADPKAAAPATPAAQQAQAEKRQEPEPEAAKPEEPKPEDDDTEAKRAVFVSADLAFTRTDIGGISDSLGFDKTGANGLLYGLATGLRLKDLRFGARWRVFDTTEYDLWSIAGTVGYGLPLRPLSPILTANVGYVWDQKINPSAYSGSLPPGTVLPPGVDVQGLLVGIDLNASYWITKFLRLGAFIGSDFMFLHREQAAVPSSIFPISPEFRNKPLYTDSGSGIAYTLNIGLRGAFDIGF